MSALSRPRIAALALALAAALGGAAAFAPTAAMPRPGDVDIPYEQFTLPNGLRVIVHTDRKAPIVAVNIWYHVGSKDEPPGKHRLRAPVRAPDVPGLGEPQGRVLRAVRAGRRDRQNGTTNSDRTNYFQNVPTTALDMALWMESDRMGHLLGAIDQKTLDEQRGVVQNEKRQGENQPYGRARRAAAARHVSRQAIRTTTAPSARWTTSTRPRSTTSRPGSAPGTARTTRCWCWPATSTWPPRRQKVDALLRRHPGRADHGRSRSRGRRAHASPRARR